MNILVNLLVSLFLLCVKSECRNLSHLMKPYVLKMDLDFKPQLENKLNKGISNLTISQIFNEELDLLFLDNNSKRFWRAFLNHLPKEQNNSRRVSRQSIEKIIDVSPLKILSLTQPTLQSSPEAHFIDASSSLGLTVSSKLSESLEHDSFDFNPVDVLAGVKASNEFCPFKKNINCNQNERFATFDGSCNNLMQPWLGKTNTPYKRYNEPAYDDRLSEPRKRSVIGGELPNPRIISRVVMSENSQIETAISHITAPFGQFIAHDISSVAVSTDDFGRIVDCPCNSNNPSCMSISLPSNDNLLRMSCMKFTRSSAAFSSFDCRLGHREQLNLMTSFVDGTQIYGPSISRSRELRSFQGGQLRSSQSLNGKQYLPQAEDGACRGTDNRVKCFAGGEGRVNENLALTSMHTIFLREHNRIASEIARLNPRWDDERLFAETRKIIIAILQHILYHEWLPIIVGWNTAAMFDLIPLNENRYYNGYNSNINPSLSGEFSSAAFRFGHTLVRSTLRRFDGNDRETSAPLNIFDIIFRPAEAYNTNAGGIDSIVMGLLNEPSSKYDANLADTLQNRLFEIRLGDGSVIAVDLAATNINRGRDHGIPSYNVMREKCGIKKANNFQDLIDTISVEKINLLSSVYKHVDDIDLYPGGLSENSVSGGVVGPTFACIIANQFRDLKRGDRFYYENGPSPTAFSLDQLIELKKATMSKIICDNFEINKIQPNAFMLPSQTLNNAKISCSWLPNIDLTKWKE